MSISTITGENGIVTKTKDAAEKTKNAEKEEQAALDIFDEYINDNSPYDHNAPELHPIGMIPEGAVYTKVDGTVLNAGEAFPTEMIAGDRYKFGDYEYGYQAIHIYIPTLMDRWMANETLEGWNAAVVDQTKSEYEPILESINGKAVGLNSTFLYCMNLTKVPVFPEGISDLTGTFAHCRSLTAAPVIPDSVTIMDSTFSGCTSLTEVPAIPDSVRVMRSTFMGCTALTTAPAIPDSVENIESIFSECKNLKTYHGSTDSDGDFSNYKLPNNIDSIYSAFYFCEKLTKAPEIPDSVTSLDNAFKYCTALITAPEIPDSVTDMGGTFVRCTSLTVAPEIPDSVTNMKYTFQLCTSLTAAPVIPDSVTTMEGTFASCTKLTGEISIPCSLVSKNYTYNDCPATVTYYHVDSCDGSCGQ